MHTDVSGTSITSMSNGAKLAALGGILGLTGIVAYCFRSSGPLGAPGAPGASKKASGANRTYLVGSGDTSSSIAARYNATGRTNWLGELSAVNPGIDWSQPLSTDRVSIPDAWGLAQ